MSAEPAPNGTPGPPGSGRVILFRKRPPTHRPRSHDAPPAPLGAGQQAPPPTLHHRFANRLEQTYLRHNRTLTDPETAEAYRIAVETFAELLEGAHATGLIDTKAHNELHAMIESMRHAPDLVENA